MNRSTTKHTIVSVAVPIPIRQCFDFIVPAELLTDGQSVCPTARVLVPFSGRKLVALIYQVKSHSDYPENKLKQVLEIIDDEAIFSAQLLRTLDWMADYYLAPIGEVVAAAIPSMLRQGRAMQPLSQIGWQLSEHGRSAAIEELSRAPLQLAIVKRLMKIETLVAADFKQISSGWRQAVKSLIEKQWLEELEIMPAIEAANLCQQKSTLNEQRPIILNTQQQQAVDSLSQQQGFVVSLLHGVTGSGKTEVYFAAIQQALENNKQVLLLVPEIGLTPQLIERVTSSFKTQIAVFHSALNETQKHLAWWQAKEGEAKIVIGTRSAVFAPLTRLGLIVIDEEHDGSFKQQEGVRYQARDVAVYRAKQEGVPIILASATPSFESYANAQAGRYHYLQLNERATQASMPKVELFDIRRLELTDGLSPMMITAIKQTLMQKKQIMLFLNRRGYAPVLYCRDCKWIAVCHRCDAPLTIHKRNNQMRCHHCGYQSRADSQCGNCESQRLTEVGEGTQRVEARLADFFPEARILRIDRDSTRNKGQLESVLQQAKEGDADILLGTQLLTKGHDFPDVAMVGVLNADHGLYSNDFRATEYLFQQLLQVAGRAGRREQIGRVFVQTAFPEHPFFEKVIQHDYHGFAELQLHQRNNAQYPPYGYFALLRAQSTHQAKALQFLRWSKRTLSPLDGVRVMDAIPAPMEKKAGKFRAQLLITADKRSALHATLSTWLDWMSDKKQSRSVKWTLDIDPMDLY